MIDLNQLTPIGRKQWVHRTWNAHIATRNYQAIQRSIIAYNDPTNIAFDEKVEVAKWNTTVKKKVNYLFARPPVAASHQATLDELLPFLKLSAREFMLRGSLIWIVDGDGKSIDPQPTIMSDTIAVYADKNREEVVCYIRERIDLEVNVDTGEQTEVKYYECYYGNKKDTFCYSNPLADTEEEYDEPLTFIQLGKTGDAPLYAYAERLLAAFDRVLNHQDKTVEGNTTPLTEVRGYSGTKDEDLEYAVNKVKIVKVEGNGGVTVHMRNMDSAAIDLWARRILQEYFEATATVGKEMELTYAQSGKALDRLFIDMDNDAKDLAEVLETALKAYFETIGVSDLDIVWNTDRPVDDVGIISSIQASRGLLSDKSCIEQHPWVEDVEEELRRLEEQNLLGVNDLDDAHMHAEDDEPKFEEEEE